MYDSPFSLLCKVRAWNHLPAVERSPTKRNSGPTQSYHVFAPLSSTGTALGEENVSNNLGILTGLDVMSEQAAEKSEKGNFWRKGGIWEHGRTKEAKNGKMYDNIVQM